MYVGCKKGILGKKKNQVRPIFGIRKTLIAINPFTYLD
jgi:hypothetical protein